MTRLPDVSLKADGTPATLLRRLHAIATAAGYGAVFRDDLQPLTPFLELSAPDSSPHTDLIVQIFHHPDLAPRLAVEVRASRWSDDGPTYDQYVAAVDRFVRPLVSAYNRKFGTRLRLNIPPVDKLVPRLPSHAAQYLDRFVHSANPGSLHLNDWVRFYDFVWHCHRRRVRLTESDLIDVLIARGVPEPTSRKLADVYDHGRNLLRRGGPAPLRRGV